MPAETDLSAPSTTEPTVVPTGYCRVTVVGGATRADLSLPEAVPVAELLADVTRFVGAPASGELHLTRSSGEPLRSDLTLADQRVLSGELLTLAAGAPPPAPRVAADVVTAVASAVDARPDLWTRTSAPGWAVPAGAVVAAVGALPLLLRQGTAGAAAAAAAVAVVLLAVSGVAGRVVRAASAWAAAVAVLYGAVSGADLAAVVGSGSPASLVAAAAAGALVAGLLAALVGRAVRGLPAVALATATLALAGAATVFLSSRPAEDAAVALLAWLWLGPLADRAAPRLVRLDASVTAPAVLRGAAVEETRRRVGRGHDLLSEVALATGLVAATAAAVLALTGGGWSCALAATGSVAVGLRARRFRLVREVVPLTAAGVVGALCLGCRLVLAVHEQPWTVGVFVAGGLLLTGAAVAVTRVGVGPAVGVVADRVEVVVLVALVPLALGVLGVYGHVENAGRGLH